MKRKLSREEAALWSRLARTVAPIDAARTIQPAVDAAVKGAGAGGAASRTAPAPSPRIKSGTASPARSEDLRIRPQTLDATWDRRLAKGLVHPDFTIDLHGHSLDSAHSRLEHGLALAQAQGARMVLLVTGRPRPAGDHASRGERRGAIRAKFLDWLAAGSHAGRIAAIRPAHPRHGGAGAVYLVLRRHG